jgi:uncharacterized membrane protein
MAGHARWPLALLLFVLAALYGLWLGGAHDSAAVMAVFVAPPLLLAAARLCGWQRAGYWTSICALGWFSHGVMRAWTDHPHSGPAWAALLLALLAIVLASGPAARARIAARRAQRQQ